jgi:hypothetical protein
MYLSARLAISSNTYKSIDGKFTTEPNDQFDQVLSALDLTRDETDSDGSVLTVNVPVMYWRKANQIHNWFVSRVQDGNDNCGTYHVSRGKLEDLIGNCEEVLSRRGNPDSLQPEDILPTVAGFFFGNTEYSDYYYEQLEYTVNSLKRVLDNENFFSADFQYESSW